MSTDQVQTNDHPAAAGFRELRGKLPELWARMPRMSSLIDVARMRNKRAVDPRDIERNQDATE